VAILWFISHLRGIIELTLAIGVIYTLWRLNRTVSQRVDRVITMTQNMTQNFTHMPQEGMRRLRSGMTKISLWFSPTPNPAPVGHDQEPIPEPTHSATAPAQVPPMATPVTPPAKVQPRRSPPLQHRPQPQSRQPTFTAGMPASSSCEQGSQEIRGPDLANTTVAAVSQAWGLAASPETISKLKKESQETISQFKKGWSGFMAKTSGFMAKTREAGRDAVNAIDNATADIRPKQGDPKTPGVVDQICAMVARGARSSGSGQAP